MPSIGPWTATVAVKRRKPLARGKPPKRGKFKPVGKYQRPEWKALRDQVRERSGGWCERCLVEPGEEVHHLRYEKGNKLKRLLVPLTDLIHLCRACHEKEHPWMRGS